ncbi:MAG: HAD-IA family hydrolase [Solirubrobacterales bacterium]|nr:HAD-IA family hydrolase [Solirubrobacterales bacterium]
MFAITPRPAAILLDALGTLVALEPPVPRLRAELARRFGLEVTEEQAARAIMAEIAYYRAHLDDGRDEAALAALRRRCAEVLRSALPGDCVRLEPERLLEALLASLRFSAFPDVRPALEAARERGQRLVVVSNWDVSLLGVLRDLGLEPLLDAIVTSAAFGERKPSPAIFAHALALAGVPAGEAIHVGDSLDEDVAGARAAGIEPILIHRGDGPAVPGVRTISSLAELTAPKV